MKRFNPASRFFLMAALLLVLVGAAHGEERFRRWGVGYGHWSQTSPAGSPYYSYPVANGFGLRYRISETWAVTVNGQFGQTVEEGDYDGGIWSWDDVHDSDESDYRILGLELSRHFHVLPKLSLNPAIRMIHYYAFSINDGNELREWDDGDWNLSEWKSTYHSDVLHLGFGLRPTYSPHPRLSIESGFFLDYWKSHARGTAWRRDEDETGAVELNEGANVVNKSGWKFTNVNPSLSMGLTLYFYF